MKTSPRANIYAVVHKGLRACMSETLSTLGRTDWTDAEDRARARADLDGLLELCESHLRHEDDFVHAAMEARRPGSSSTTGGDHIGHVEEIGALRGSDRDIEQAADRAEAGARLYHRLARFVAENFEHMEIEERDNNAVLWAHYTDAEILEIERRLVASIPPERMGRFLRWMLPYANAHERAELLGDMKRGAPREVFAGVMEMLRGLLQSRDWNKLTAAVGV